MDQGPKQLQNSHFGETGEARSDPDPRRGRGNDRGIKVNAIGGCLDIRAGKMEESKCSLTSKDSLHQIQCIAKMSTRTSESENLQFGTPMNEILQLLDINLGLKVGSRYISERLIPSSANVFDRDKV
jgi:hypothetical protein